jgi:hypothetical protein
MASGIVNVVWSVRDLIEAALAEVPSAPPVRQPLTLASETGPVRRLPGERGWLRLVQGGEPSPDAAPAPDPPPVPPVAPGQLDLFDRPVAPLAPPPPASPPRPMVQLRLFDPPEA